MKSKEDFSPSFVATEIGKKALLSGWVPMNIILAIVDAMAYAPATSEEKNIFARIMSKDKNRTIARLMKKTGFE